MRVKVGLKVFQSQVYVEFMSVDYEGASYEADLTHLNKK